MSNPSARWTIRLDGSGLPERALIGGKAWSLARMRALGLPVPPAFVITTRACVENARHGAPPDGLEEEISAGLAWLEQQSGRSFGGDSRPLLLSVRSGAAISMPGMMDTVLNLGISDAAEAALAEECGDAAFARDTHRRYHEMYARVVLKATIDDLDAEEDAAQWRRRIAASGTAPMPETLHEQLHAAVHAVFDSWQSRRAKRYRKHHGIDDELGTAVTLQAMVFGNMDANSGTGVLFSRNPLNGNAEPYGEYLPCAQGEDVVSGRFTPQPLEFMRDNQPEAYAELLRAAQLLEHENGDVQDIEFTVQQGTLYLLQSRNAKRAPAAAVRIAVDLHDEGIISIDDALARVSPMQVRSLLSPHLAEGASEGAELLASGDGASPGVGSGVVVIDSDTAEQRAAAGESVVLARRATSPDDLHGMLAARAVITETGGTTSHAAVVGRALGLPCVVGCGSDSVTQLDGVTVTVDGDNGKVWRGSLPVQQPQEQDDQRLSQLLAWARERSPLTVLAASEAPADARIIDLDQLDGGGDPARLDSVIAAIASQSDGARGGAIASDEGIAAAMTHGLKFIVAEPALPALLTALQRPAGEAASKAASATPTTTASRSTS